MKATGMIRKIDHLGRIVIPMEIRKSFEIKDGEPMEIFTGDNNQIILKKYNPGCQECGNAGIKLHGDNVKLCKPCMDKLYTNL